MFLPSTKYISPHVNLSYPTVHSPVPTCLYLSPLTRCNVLGLGNQQCVCQGRTLGWIWWWVVRRHGRISTPDKPTPSIPLGGTVRHTIGNESYALALAPLRNGPTEYCTMGVNTQASNAGTLSFTSSSSSVAAAFRYGAIT